MGDGILDGFPIIQDQTSPNLAHIPTTNLILNSNVFVANSATLTPNYGISPDGTQNSTRIETSGNNSGTRISISNSNNNAFAYSVFVKGVLGETVNVRVETSPYSLLIQYNFTFNGEWQRVENVLTASNTHTQKNFYVTHLGGSTATDFQIYGSQIEQQSQATAYLPSYGIASVRKATTTNLVTYSEDFSQSNWTNTDITFGANGVSPTGTNNANLIQTGSAGNDQVKTLVTLSATNTVTQSIYIKRVSGAEWVDFLIVKSGFSNSVKVWFNISTGVVGNNLQSGTTSLNNASIDSVGNNWYRLNITTTDTTNNTSFDIRVRTASANASDTRFNNSSYYLWGAQLEEQTQAETYAKTTGLPVTIDLFTENNYGTMTNMSANDIVEDTP
jgi:hypothetical protein